MASIKTKINQRNKCILRAHNCQYRKLIEMRKIAKGGEKTAKYRAKEKERI